MLLSEDCPLQSLFSVFLFIIFFYFWIGFEQEKFVLLSVTLFVCIKFYSITGSFPTNTRILHYFLWMDLYFIHIRMLQTGKESMPDDESYELVVGMLFLTDQIDAALRYVDLTLKSGYMLSMRVFAECVRSCVNKGRLDALVSIIERCKVHD